LEKETERIPQVTAQFTFQKFQMVRSTLAHVQTNIMSHNLVTDIKTKLTCSKIGKKLGFHRNQTSKIELCISILQQTQEPSPSLRRNQLSMWALDGGYMQG
jgi:hypothetical protein